MTEISGWTRELLKNLKILKAKAWRDTWLHPRAADPGRRPGQSDGSVARADADPLRREPRGHRDGARGDPGDCRVSSPG